MSESELDRLLYETLEGDIDRKHGEGIIAMAKDAKERQGSEEHPLLEALGRAHRAKAEEADKQWLPIAVGVRDSATARIG